MDSITVHTIQDLEQDAALPPKRKNASKACASCRRLKLRCRELATKTDDSPCEHCLKVGNVCSWPEEDARKRSRTKSKERFTLHSHADGTAYDSVPAAEVVNYNLQVDGLNCQQSNSHDLYNDPISLAWDAAPSSRAPRVPHTVLQYYRYLGSTAIVPGYKKVSLKVINDGNSSSKLASDSHDSRQPVVGDIFDPYTNSPRAQLLQYLLDAFFEYYGSNFCFLHRGQLENLIRTNKISSFLLCSIAALSSRFCAPEIFAPYISPLPDGQQRECWELSLPFLGQAKKLLLPLLNIPSCDLVAGLLFLALAEFGVNNEAGMWMFTGMSIRVAQELGLHRQRPSIYTSIGCSPTNDATGDIGDDFQSPSTSNSLDCQEFERSSQILLFWCLFVQDTSLANGTGRVPSIKQSEISIRLPTDQDIAIVQAGPGSSRKSTQTCAFPYMVSMMLEYARSIEFLNTDDQPEDGFPAQTARLQTIQSIKNRILSSYNATPETLRCGATQYRHASNSGQGIPYLVMHLNFHLQIAFLVTASHAIMCPNSVSGHNEQNRRGDYREYSVSDAESSLSHKAEDQLYRKAMKSIVDILTIARFVDSRPLHSTFFLNQPIFHAACAYMGDMLRFQSHSSQQFPLGIDRSVFPLPSPSSTSVVFDLDEENSSMCASRDRSSADDYLALLAKTNYQFLRQAIKEMAKYYAGAGWVDAVLDQRESGIRDVDLSIVSESISTYIRLHDLRAAQHPSSQVPGRPQVCESAFLYGGDPMLSQDFLSDISPNFDSQAFFDDYIFAGK